MTLDIPKKVEGVDKAEKEKEEVDLEEEVEAASIGQLVDQMKQIDRPIPLTVAIRDPGLKKQKLNIIIVKE
jgi:hypothetical protein